MITSPNEQKFALFLLSVAEMEEDLETYRRIIKKVPGGVDTYGIFNFVDTHQQKIIDEFGLMDFLSKNDILSTHQEVKQLITFYDADLDGGLNYGEFLNIILPNKEDVEADFDVELMNNISNSGFKINTTRENNYKHTVYNLTLQILEKELNLSRIFLQEEENVKQENFFNIIERSGRKYFKYDELKKFFNRNALVVSDDDVNSVIRRLDIDRDGKVSTIEFYSVFNCKRGRAKPKDFRDDFSHSYSQIFHESKRESPSNFMGNSDASYASTKIYSKTPDRGIKKDLNNSSVQKFGRHFKYKLQNHVPTYIPKLKPKIPNLIPKYRSADHDYPSKEEIQFFDFLRNLIEIENGIEQLKCNLSLKDDFNLERIFYTFETEGKQYVTLSEFKEGLNKLDLFPTTEEINTLLKKYDLNKTGVLYFIDFCDIFYPVNSELRINLENKAIRDVEKYNYGYFTNETVKLVRQLLSSLLIGEWKIEALRKQLNELKRFSMIEIFKKIDIENNKYILDEDVRDMYIIA